MLVINMTHTHARAQHRPYGPPHNAYAIQLKLFIHLDRMSRKCSFAYGFHYKLMSIFGTTFRIGLDVICEAHTHINIILRLPRDTEFLSVASSSRPFFLVNSHCTQLLTLWHLKFIHSAHKVKDVLSPPTCLDQQTAVSTSDRPIPVVVTIYGKSNQLT